MNEKQIILTKNAPAPIGTYNQAIAIGNTVYISGQIALDKTTQQLCSDDIHAQIHKVIENLSAICVAAGGSLASIVKLSVYLVNIQHAPLINELMAVYFSEPYPARVMLEVSALPRGALVEIEAIMIK